jgi:hypothetical protein
MCSRNTGEFEIHLNGAKSIIDHHHKSNSSGAMFFEQRLTWYVIMETGLISTRAYVAPQA